MVSDPSQTQTLKFNIAILQFSLAAGKESVCSPGVSDFIVVYLLGKRAKTMKKKNYVETQKPSPDKESNSEILRWKISMEIGLTMSQKDLIQAYQSHKS